MNQPGASPQDQTLSRELSVFLVQFSVGLHKAGAYPPNHPVVREAIESVYVQLLALLTERDTLAIGVAHDQLLVDGMATDSHTSVLAELAKRLHRHQVGAVRFQEGVALEELTDLVTTLCREADREEMPFGLRPSEELDRWQHIQVVPHTFGSLALAEDGMHVGEGPDHQSQLWLRLAAAALGDQDDDAPTTDAAPDQIAEAIKQRRDDRSYDKVIVEYLTQAGRELKLREGATARVLKQRIAGLVQSLDQNTLGRLLDVGGGSGDRTQLLSNLSATLPVDAVMDLVNATAKTGEQKISNSFLRMLSKLAAHTDTNEATALRPNANETFRESVQALIDDWTLEDPNPEAYTDVLERLATGLSDETSTTTADSLSDDSRIVQMGLEVGVFGVTVVHAVDDMLRTDRFQELLQILDTAPESSSGTDNVWNFLTDPERVRYLLAHYEHDIEGVQRVLERLDPQAADPLLDALATTTSRAMRHRLLSTMTSMGSEIGPKAAARLPGAEWYVKRNILILMGSLPEWPAGFSPQVYALADDARVRREAVKLMLQAEETEMRDSAILIGVVDDDVSIIRMTLTAATATCPQQTENQILELFDHDDGDVRVLAIRVLGCFDTPRARKALLSLSLAKRRWWQRRRRLATASPEMLAALGSLARAWADSPDVQVVLESARNSSHEEIRAMVTSV